MKTILLIAIVATSTVALADNYVPPYVRNDGTFVEGHFKSAPDTTINNNYSTQGNVNPYTGQAGTHQPNPNGYVQQPSYPGANSGYNSGYGSQPRSRY